MATRLSFHAHTLSFIVKSQRCPTLGFYSYSTRIPNYSASIVIYKPNFGPRQTKHNHVYISIARCATPYEDNPNLMCRKHMQPFNTVGCNFEEQRCPDISI